MLEFENPLKETKIYKTLKKDFKESNLSHCIMIISEDSVACTNLCKIIARMLLCEHDDCGMCKTCIQVEKGLFPSLIVPQNLTADGLRDFIAACYKKVDTNIKVALISNFQDIDAREQNRLLKLIEEPAGDTIFIMGVTKVSAVLETIKSRATKYTIEQFDDAALKNALLDHYDSYSVEKAMAFSEGSIEKAQKIIANPEFIDSYNTMLRIFNDMQKSSGLLEMVARTNIRNKRTFSDKINALERYLDAFEEVLRQVVEYKSGLNTNADDIIKQISDKYNMATLVNVEDLIIESKKKADANCDPEGVFYQLLMDILEVKFKCQS